MLLASKRRRFGVLYKKIWKSIPLAPRDTHSSHRCWKTSHPPPGGHTTWSYQSGGLMGFERASHPPLVKGLLAALSPSLRPFPSAMKTAHRLSIIDSDGWAQPNPHYQFTLLIFLLFFLFQSSQSNSSSFFFCCFPISSNLTRFLNR